MLLPLTAGAQSSASAPAGPSAGNIYDTIRASVQKEISVSDHEQEVVDYLVKLYNKPEFAIKAALSGDAPLACQQASITDRGQCGEFVLKVVTTGKQELSIRQLGRKLQEIVSGEEIPVTYIPGRPISLAMDLGALVNIWVPGDKAPKNLSKDISLQTTPLDPAVTDTLLGQLNAKLSTLPREEMIAAVWRYDHGVRLVQDVRNPPLQAPYIYPQNVWGTEGQMLTKRWNYSPYDIEQSLMDIWNALPPDFPFVENRITYYTFRNTDTFLPPNVLVWARKGKLRKGTQLVDFGDVGLAFQTPLEPVMPSLLKKDANNVVLEAILGGTYPPEPVRPSFVPGIFAPVPVDGRKLCTDPIGSRGFLCPYANEKGCPPSWLSGILPADPNAINLVNCVSATGSLTIAGGDICRDIAWRRTAPRTPDEPGWDVNKQCIVDYTKDLACEAGPFSGGRAEPKQPNGHIRLTVNPGAALPFKYIWIHELTHAYQACHLPTGMAFYAGAGNPSDPPAIRNSNTEICCRIEGEAYRAQCDAMEEDGLLRNRTTGQRLRIDSIEIDATSCTEIYTGWSCNDRYGGRCSLSRNYPKLDRTLVSQPDSLAAKLEAAIAANAVGLIAPQSCSDSIKWDTMDVRMKAQLLAMSGSYRITDPLNETMYRNTIGNAMCFVGNSAEETFELHNPGPGRTPAGVMDGKDPFRAVARTSSSSVSATGSQFPVMEPPMGRLPDYKPLAIVEEFEASLCEQQGLPVRTPAVLCTLQYSRRLQMPLADYILNADSLSMQEVQQQVPLSQFNDLASGLGARISTGIYEKYAPRVFGPITSLMKEAVRQLKILSAIRFPEQMCPLGPA
jgi:hypothetical protein